MYGTTLFLAQKIYDEAGGICDMCWLVMHVMSTMFKFLQSTEKNVNFFKMNFFHRFQSVHEFLGIEVLTNENVWIAENNENAWFPTLVFSLKNSSMF